MNIIVPRTCTEIPRQDLRSIRKGESGPLREFRAVSAYVLLGDPGSGKSTEFERECKELGDEAALITARNFLAFDPNNHPEWWDKTLFIDGLDEVRVGTADARTPFDQIRSGLDQLGRPMFRISCREADWLGENDRRHLEEVSQDSQVRTLRLDPLTDSDIAHILNGCRDDIDAQEFMAEACNRGTEELLHNPQTLGLLADSVAQDGGWPESRLETFEKACLQMAREQNEEHRIPGHLPEPDELLDAAGHLCAVQLISGSLGYSLNWDDPSADYLALDACGYGSAEMLRHSLSTKLFKGEAPGCFTPIHRHIAEFLGARHLAKVISGGLPERRVISLITGVDGIVVTELRGLSAWLAAHSQDVRDHLIGRDPIGVGLYGDIREFSVHEKRKLIKALKQEMGPADTGYSPIVASAFSPLAAPEMVLTICDALTDPRRERDQQMLVVFLLEVLSYGRPLPDLLLTLVGIVRDETRWPWVKQLGIHAFINNCVGDEDRPTVLKEILTDVHAGRISDPNDELLGVLLTNLYPREIGPSDVWDYLSGEGNPWFIGAYAKFWDQDLLNQSTEEDAVHLLDHFSKRLSDLQLALVNHHMENLPIKLLGDVLETHGDIVTPARVYDWLSTGLFEDWQDSAVPTELTDRIRVWLEQRPEIQKAVISEGLKRWARSNLSGYRYHVRRLMYGAALPPDFGHWCLDQAVATPRLQAAKCFLEWAVEALGDRVNAEGLSLEVILERTQQDYRLKDVLDPLLASKLPQDHLETRKRFRGRQRYVDRDRQERRSWLDGVRSHVDDLRENRAAHTVLHQVAKAYYNRQESLCDLMGHDSRLIEAVRAGLRRTVWRADIPDVADIIRVAAESQTYFIALPYLANIDEMEREKPEQLSQLPEPQMRKALAFYYHTPTGRAGEPEWYRKWLKEFPTVVADVLGQCAMSAIRNGEEHIPGLDGLAHEQSHSEVARQVSLSLLRGFPVRCRSQQLATLDELLWAALRHADRASFQELVERKLSRKSMNVSQRVHWLSAGLMLSPEKYRQPLEDFVTGHDDRTRQLASFCCPSERLFTGSDNIFSPLVRSLEIAVLELLIRLIGSSFGPVDMANAGWVRVEHLAHARVRELIQRLASLPDEDSAGALKTLSTDEGLYQWRDVLDEARNRQLVIRRDAMYRHPDAEQICGTLNGGLPANAGDLSALVLDWLKEMRKQIRTGNTDDWRQYWNEDSNGRHSGPKHEESCRDAFLSDLKQRLPQGVDALREVSYAGNKRSDIRVAHLDFNIPVEVKKNTHRDLWSALRDQLIAKYSSGAGTDGYGIYLVFWFGADCTQSPPTGSRPASPEELREQLEATLTGGEARKISICVIDVTQTK